MILNGMVQRRLTPHFDLIQHLQDMKQDFETVGIYTGFVRQLLAEYLEHPDLLAVECYYSEHVVRIIILPAPTDFGKVLGQGGRGLDALKVLLNEKGALDGDRVELKLAEPENRVPVERRDRHVNNSWGASDDQRIGQILTRILDQTVRISAEIIIKPSPIDTTLTIRPNNGDKISLNAATALNTIFRAIGSKHGRRITVNARH